MSEPLALQMPARPNFMVVDGKTYLVDKIEQSPEDMLKHVEEFYKDSMQVMQDQVTRHLSAESRDDLHKQVERIERHLSSNVIIVPEGLRQNGTLLTLRHNKVWATKLIMFKPSRISVTMLRVTNIVHWVNNDISKRDAERFTKFVEWSTPLIAHLNGIGRDLSGIMVDITVNQDMEQHAMVVSYCVEDRHIYAFPEGVHPHVFSGGRLCTGNTNADVFWQDAGFAANFNSLNPHSFAVTTGASNNYKQMLKNQYFIDGRIREEAAWRVS